MVDLAHCLTAMGARISGIGSSTLEIDGVASLAGADYTVMPDRIEAGTYLVAVAATGGRVRLEGAVPHHLDIVLEKLREASASIEIGDDWIELDMQGRRPSSVAITTAPIPVFQRTCRRNLRR